MRAVTFPNPRRHRASPLWLALFLLAPPALVFAGIVAGNLIAGVLP